MALVLDALVKLLSLERIEENLFRGQSEDLGWGRLYGGHVLGQALSAATQTVPSDRYVHSLHAYFLKTGEVTRPVVYDVDRIRDGKSFTTRRVVAIQGGHAIFNLQVSFHKDEPGFSHQDPMPENVPAPETLMSDQERTMKYIDRVPELLRERAVAERPFDMKIIGPNPSDPLNPEPMPPTKMMWLKARGQLPDTQGLHRWLLAYASDYGFVTTALHPHGVSWLTPGMQIASIDHVMWFHAPFRMDEWLLHVIESQAAGGSRGIVRGRVFTRDGRLVASTAQEGLMRRHG
jgi:acyl-CoA thioesterase-2